MALYREDIVDIDLIGGSIHRSFLMRSIGKADILGNRFGVRLFRNGQPENIGGGSCTGLFMAPNGQNILISGSGNTGVSGNVAWVQLPQACYNVEGQFALAIKISNGTVTGTMRIVDGMVENTGSDSPVAPTGTVPTYEEVLAVYDEMQDAVEYTERVKDAIRTSVSDMGAFFSHTDREFGGVSFEWDDDNKMWYVSGTAEADSGVNLFESGNAMPFGIKAGETYWIEHESTNVYLEIWDYSGGSASSRLISTNQSGTIKIPTGITGLIIRLYVYSGATVDEWVNPGIYPITTTGMADLVPMLKGIASRYSDETNLNNYLESGRYTIDCQDMTNAPLSSGTGVFDVINYGSIITQEVVFPTGLTYFRAKIGSGAFGDWIKVFQDKADMTRTGTKVNVDLDDVAETQYCLVDESCTNKPLSSGVGMLNVLNYGSIITQEFIFTTGLTYFRAKNGSSAWGDWIKVFQDKADVTRTSTKTNISIDTLMDTMYCFIDASCTGQPSGATNGFLVVYNVSPSTNLVLQQFINYSNKVLYQRSYFSGAWSNWTTISGGGTIENTYNITTNPTITTDTNNWLQAVDDESTTEENATDMTGAIMSMLTDTGYCKLSPGTFYVSGNIDMPVGSMIEGCGKDTIVRLLSSVSNGYIFKPLKNNTICNMTLSGSKTNPSYSETTTRHGVYFVGNADGEEGATVVTAIHSILHDLFIENFTGSGIYCHNSGGGVKEALLATNIMIDACKVGINVDYFSEYHKFTNVITCACDIACINNGGNNVYTSCTFHGNKGFVMDNAQHNPGHGSCVGCVFNHIGGNTGTGIEIIGEYVPFVFDGCQNFYGKIVVKNSKGIVFSNMILGGNPNITVENSTAIMFDGCMFYQEPTISASGNTTFVFANCYRSDTGAAVTP